MQVFYAPNIEGKEYILGEAESKHTVRVLRMGAGSAIRLIDGKGNLFDGVISMPDQKACRVKITGVIRDFEKRDYHLHIAISPLKNPERLEWFVEKCVEIGIDEITPLICHNSEKVSVKPERLNNIIVSAMKQSLKARLPVLNGAQGFGEFIAAKHNGKLMIATCDATIERKGIEETCARGGSIVILIGPEGDFSTQEVSQAMDNGYIPVHLGASRLRTETAGVAACHSVYFINQ